MVNKVMLVGRLGRDPELRHTGSGTAVCNFSVATDEGYKDKTSGDWVKKTEWHNIVAWGRLAEICGDLLAKGKLVFIEGKLQTREWEKDGVKRYTTEVNAFVMKLLEPKGSGGEDSAQAPAEPESDEPFVVTDDDVPF